MNHFEIIARLERIHSLIEREGTGSVDEFAARFGVNRRRLFALLDELKSTGAIIKFDRNRQTYYYANDYVFPVKFVRNP